MTDLDGLALVVVNYGPPDLLETTLVPVARALAPARVVVVDNWSSASAREAVRELCGQEGWTGLYPDRNTGFGSGTNLGAEVALGEGARHLLLLNPDASIDRESAGRLLAAVQHEPLLLAAPTIFTPDGRLWSAGSDLDLELGDMRSWRRRAEAPDAVTMPWVSGACLLVSETLWQLVGGFDDDYFLYWEDVDLSARVHAAGGRVDVVEQAVAVHDEGSTHADRGSRAKSATYYYYNVRNRQLFAAKWLDDDRRRRWGRTALPAAYRVVLRGGRRQLLRSTSPLVASLRGVRDGRRMARTTGVAPAPHGRLSWLS